MNSCCEHKAEPETQAKTILESGDKPELVPPNSLPAPRARNTGGISISKPKRIGLSKRTRFEVFKRDGFKCMYCGATPPSVILHVDHVIPVAGGGSNDLLNLVTSCQGCNSGKSDIPLSLKPKALLDAAEEDKERFEQMQGYNEWLSKKRRIVESWYDKASNHWIASTGSDPEVYEVDSEIEKSVRRFLVDLPYQKIIEAIDIAMLKFPLPPGYKSEGGASDYNMNARVRYFYGVCWHMIKGDYKW